MRFFASLRMTGECERQGDKGNPPATLHAEKPAGLLNPDFYLNAIPDIFIM